jgi:hypothetical protein
MGNKVSAAAYTMHPKVANFIISGDTGVNIFDDETMLEYRERYIDTLCKIVSILDSHGHDFSYDHVFPTCFWTQEMMDRVHEINITPPHLMRRPCCHTILGLLDTNFDLWYCNQTRIKVGNMFVNGHPRRMEEVHRMLADMPCKKCESLRPECQKCPAKDTCKTGCWHDHAS